MIKKVIAVLLLICICFSVCALDMSKAQPYKEGEFPKWALDLRRGEIIFLGSLPVTYPITSLVMGAMNKEQGFWDTMKTAAVISAAIAVADYVIGIVDNK